MKAIRQILRQPMKTLSGVVTVALAVAMLCICVSQSLAARSTAAALERSFTTVGLSDETAGHYVHDKDSISYDEYQGASLWEGGKFGQSESYQKFLDSMEAEHPQIVKTVANPGLASAYIPELTVDNKSHHPGHSPYLSNYETAPTYDCAMVEITLTEIGEPYLCVAEGVNADGIEADLTWMVTVELTGTVEQVLSAEEGYGDITGKTAQISLRVPDEESLAALDLEVGGRYLVYTNYFRDGNWLLKSAVVRYAEKVAHFGQEPKAVDWDEIRLDTIWEMKGSTSETPYYVSYGVGTAFLTEEQVSWKDSVLLRVWDRSQDGTVRRVSNQERPPSFATSEELLEYSRNSYPVLDYARYITDENGQQVQISQEHWEALYGIPTMARLEGTAEEFLASEDGQLWREYLEYTGINHHAFPIIGVEQLGYIAEFARGNARILEGRDFTQEELETGAKVCVISEGLAQINGLEVGDTVQPRFYNCDPDNPNQGYLSDSDGLTDPWAYGFSATSEWAGEAEEYTIVGIYRYNNAWGDPADNLYSFTPNTIFVPEASVTGDMDYSHGFFFETLVLQNGAVPEFRAMALEAGFEGYVFYDQGYTLIQDSLTAYEELAEQAILLGLGIYGVILLLFLFLFPGSQGKTLQTMTALGAKRGQKLGHIIMSSAGILLPGTLIGLGAGLLLWDRVAAWLTESAPSALTLEMEPGVLWGIALAQLALALGLVLLLSLPLSRSKGIHRRK